MTTYGLIGKKLSHSFSAEYFNTKFEDESIDSVYKLFEISDIKDIYNLLKSETSLRGLNVTIPFKEVVLPFLNGFDTTVKETGAANTIKIVDKKLFGFNTDVIGFEHLLKPLINNRCPKALVFGTGGAAKAVVFVLKKMNIPFQTISRTKEKGNLLWKEITPDIISDNELLINTTPLGMHPLENAAPSLPYEAITANHIAIDLIYNPETTLFLKQCQQQKAVISNGLTMLYTQAEAAWKIWNLDFDFESLDFESISLR